MEPVFNESFNPIKTAQVFDLVDSWFLCSQARVQDLCRVFALSQTWRNSQPAEGNFSVSFPDARINKPYNDLASLLPQPSSLFIVTGNYTMERLLTSSAVFTAERKML